MVILKLAIRNLLGAGLRTWLNVGVLSLVFVIIVFYNGLLDGWNRMAREDTKAWETGSGQYWLPGYDRYDPFSLQDSHAQVPAEASLLISEHHLTPILITQASIYPQGRMINILLKGIDPAQKILKLPSDCLKPGREEVPAMIGQRMADEAHLRKGDHILARWRDVNGTFDAREVVINVVFSTNVPSVDLNQLYIPLDTLREMMGMRNEATILVASLGFKGPVIKGWELKNNNFLLRDFDDIIKAKKSSSKVIYLLLLSIALLAIFDTQVLSIFRRQREIGTYIALGMNRGRVILLFTMEGAIHSLLALLLASIYGIPFLMFLQRVGIPMPKSLGQSGIIMSEHIIPFYSLGMIVSTILLVVISATIVSYYPTRRISRMKPTDALKGKIL